MRRRDTGTSKNFFAANAELPTLAASLDRIYKKVNAEGLGEGTSHELETDIQAVADRFGISPKAAVLLPAILENSFKNGCDDDDLSGYVGCSNIEFIGFRGAIREMEDRDIINRRTGRGNRYVVSRETLRAVEKDTEFVPMKKTELSADELFTRFRIVYADFMRDNIDSERLLEELMALIDGNPQLEFCRRAAEALSNPSFCDTEKRFFLTLCHRYVSHGDASVPIEKLMAFTEFMEDDECIKRHFAHETMPLQRNGLVSFAIEDGFVDNNSLSLSDQVKAEFFCEVELAPEESVRHRDIISADTIQARELYYNDAESAQVARLENLLDTGNFKEIRRASCRERV